MSVAKEIWKTIKYEDYTDSNGNQYINVFNGNSAVKCMVNILKYAPDEEDAIDYLTMIMDEEGAFSRIDVNQENEFENDINAHYQWVVEFNSYDKEEYEIKNDNENVSASEVMIGVRHSYGGFQRLMKHNRRIGGIQTVDPKGGGGAGGGGDNLPELNGSIHSNKTIHGTVHTPSNHANTPSTPKYITRHKHQRYHCKTSPQSNHFQIGIYYHFKCNCYTANPY